MNSTDLFKLCFAFYVDAMEMPPVTLDTNLDSKERENILNVVMYVQQAVDMENPRFDKFVDGLASLKSIYGSHHPKIFHPSFYQMMNSLENYSLKDAAERIRNPHPADMKVMLMVSRSLNEMLARDEIFMPSTSVSGDAFDPDDI